MVLSVNEYYEILNSKEYRREAKSEWCSKIDEELKRQADQGTTSPFIRWGGKSSAKVSLPKHWNDLSSDDQNAVRQEIVEQYNYAGWYAQWELVSQSLVFPYTPYAYELLIYEHPNAELHF